jgi:hypothetical protein
MPIIKIDNKEYEFDTLSATAKDQLQSLQFVDSELDRLQSQVAVLQTARAAYGRALNESLLVTLPSMGGDTIKLG